MGKITCGDCGACCLEMCSPPFMPESFGGTELGKLPIDVRKNYKEGMEVRKALGWPDDVPCFWVTDEYKCRYYDHRPEICRELEVGGKGCKLWRGLFNIDA